MNIENINEERKRQHLSVAELAQRAKLPKGTVEKVLFGIVKHPRIDTMQAIEKALGFYQEIDNPPSLNLKPEYQRIFESQSPEVQENILEFMRVFSKASLKTQIKILGRVEGWILDEESRNFEEKNVKR